MDARLRRFMLINTLILLAIALLISACKTTDPPAEETTTLSDPQAQSATTTSVERGQELYRANCEACHGGKGERGAAPLKDNVQQLDEATISEFIVTGVPAKGMPKLAALTSEQIADIVAFIRSWNQ